MATKKTTIDELLPIIDAAVDEWKTENSHEEIKKKVKHRLDQASKEVTLKLLGFNNMWGDKWEIDNCNGRKNSTIVGKLLQDAQEEAIKEWLGSVLMPKLTPALKTKLQKAAQDDYARNLEEYVRRAARAQSEKDAKALVDEMTSANSINNYLRLRDLIAAPESTEG